MSEIVVPGQRLGREEELVGGPGTYVRQGVVHAARLGVKTVIPPMGTAAQTEQVCIRVSICMGRLLGNGGGVMRKCVCALPWRALAQA